MSINDAQNCSGALLPLMMNQFGLVHEPEMGMQQERQLVQNAVHLYKQKGSPRGITEFTSILTSYPTTQLVHHGYNLLMTRDDGVMADAVGTWQAWPPTGSNFPSIGGTATGQTFTWVPNVSPPCTNPLETYPSNFPTLQPPYNNSGMSVQATGAGDLYATTAPVPVTDFMSQYYGQGNVTFTIQVWSSVSRQVYLSLWGDNGTGSPIQIIAPTAFAETAGHWTVMTVTGTLNPYPNTTPGSPVPQGAASYYWLYPRIRIQGTAANEAHYVTLCALWPCTPAQVGVDTPVYDYPRDIKVLVQPTAANLLTNPVTTFSRIDPNTSQSVGIGFDGLTNTADPNAPSTLNLVTGDSASFENGTVGTYTTLNCTTANSTNFAQVGTHSLAVTSTVIGSPTNRVYVRWGRFAATANQVLATSAWFRPATVARSVTAYLVFFNAQGTNLGSNLPPGAIGEVLNQWTQYTTTQTAPVGTTQAELRLEIQYPGAVGEIHYVDNVSITYANVVQTCNMSIRYASIEDPPSLLPVNGTAGLQIGTTGPGATIWWGTVLTWSPAPVLPFGWFPGTRPTPPPAYTDGHTNDWFFGAATGTNPRNWTDPTWGWFMANQTFFGVGSAMVNGIWFALPPQPILYGNLSAFTVAPGQPFNFSVYAQYITVQDPSNAQMLLGLRWYYPDGTWVENTYPVMLTDTYQRYSMPTPNDNSTYYLGDPPIEQSTGVLPTLVYPFVRFPLAQNAQFLVNSAMLSPGLALTPYMDASTSSGASGDFVADPISNASYVYPHRTPRIARLNAEMYRWVPMGSTYSITYASGAVTPPLDPTLW
jgi:hypothetical protein